MIVSVGTRVRVTDRGEITVGQVGVVIGYRDRPVTSISRHNIRLDGDITFKYPSLFSWQFEIVEEPVRPANQCLR